MWCPKCGAEYKTGYTRCADCGVELETGSAPEKPEEDGEYIDFECVLTTYNPADIAFIKSILDQEGIAYYFQGENFSRIQPLVEPAKLMVRKDQTGQAKEIMADLKINFMGPSVSKK